MRADLFGLALLVLLALTCGGALVSRADEAEDAFEDIDRARARVDADRAKIAADSSAQAGTEALRADRAQLEQDSQAVRRLTGKLDSDLARRAKEGGGPRLAPPSLKISGLEAPSGGPPAAADDASLKQARSAVDADRDKLASDIDAGFDSDTLRDDQFKLQSDLEALRALARDRDKDLGRSSPP